MDSTITTPYVMDEDMTDPINAIALPICALISILSMYLPFKSFYESRNFPAGNIIVMALIQNLMIITNALIWRDGDMTEWYNGAGICDIQVYLRIPTTTAVATSLFAFTRTLSKAIDIEKHSFIDSKARRRRALVVDVLICWTIPLIQMGLMYLILSNRYNIMPVYGCIAVADASWPTILILIPWAPLCSLLSAVEAVRIFKVLRKQKTNLSNILSSTNSAQSSRRYVKLLVLASSLIVIVIPVEAIYTMFMIEPRYYPYSFSTIHNPDVWPLTVQLPTSQSPRVQYGPWISILLSFLVFFFFGFSDDAIDHYRKWLVAVGFGHIWPTLKETRDERRTRQRETSTPNESRRSSGWRGTLDIVSYVHKHFEGDDRKNSQTTTLGGTPRTQSRKNSQAAHHSTIALTAVASNTSSQSSVGTSAPYRSFFGQDEIEHAAASRVTAKLPKVIEETSSNIPPSPPTVTRSLLGTWRTHLSLPFPLFRQSSHKNTTAKQSGLEASISTTTSQRIDSIPRSKHNSRKSSLATQSFPSTMTSTTIWSDPTTVNDSSEGLHSTKASQILSHVSCHSDSSHASFEIDDQLDPLSPKFGSRAYRERERREMERNRKEESERRNRDAEVTSHVDNI